MKHYEHNEEKLIFITKPRTPWLIILLCIIIFIFGCAETRLAIYGDTRSNPEIHRQIVQEILRHKPDLVFHTGDLNSRGSQQSEYDVFHQIIRPLTEGAGFYPARGNHEKSLDLFLANFPQLPGRSYYAVERFGIRFIVLDSVIKLYPDSDQFRWLRAELTKLRPTILIVHHPVFSSGEHGDELGRQMFLPRSLEAKNVLAVFSAHDHNYERSFYNGIYYIVTGGGGAPLREGSHPNPNSQVLHKTNHYLIARLKGGNLHFTAYALDGEILDNFTLELNQP